MKVLFLTHNDVTSPLVDWLTDEANEEVVVYDGVLSTEVVQEIDPDFAISYNYRYIIGQEVIDLLGPRIINLHVSLLPWNKGADPNVWSFLDDTPKGVTIHQLEAGLDTGHILVQEEVFFDEASETLSSTYEKLHAAIQRLFETHWNEIKTLTLERLPQAGPGSRHVTKDFGQIESILGDEGWHIPITLLQERYQQLNRD